MRPRLIDWSVNLLWHLSPVSHESSPIWGTFDGSSPRGYAGKRRGRGRKGGLDMPEGYCVKERKKVEIKDAKQVTMKNGRPAIQGVCPDCGTKIFKIGKLEA
jgi:Domain of unknown function (DUF5679)